MPKHRKASSSSDSDDSSASDPPEKKTKPSEKRSSSPSGEDNVWTLDRYKRVTLREFKGKMYIDIREFYEKDGKQLPGKKGISLTPELWRKLISLSDEITGALSKSC